MRGRSLRTVAGEAPEEKQVIKWEYIVLAGDNISN